MSSPKRQRRADPPSDDQLAGLERAFGILEGDLSLSRDQIAAYAVHPRRVAVPAGTVTTHDACTGASLTADVGYAVEVVVRYKSESDGADRGAPCTETMVVGRDDDIGSVGACTVCPPLEKQLVWLFAMLYRKVFRRFKGARTSLSERGRGTDCRREDKRRHRPLLRPRRSAKQST